VQIALKWGSIAPASKLSSEIQCCDGARRCMTQPPKTLESRLRLLQRLLWLRRRQGAKGRRNSFSLPVCKENANLAVAVRVARKRVKCKMVRFYFSPRCVVDKVDLALDCWYRQLIKDY
jgi:hypothetical protein